MIHTNQTPSAAQPDWARSLPRDAFREVSRVLRDALPPVPGGAAAAGQRDRAALAAVAGFQPETPAEARLAAQFVAADAWALDCLRLAGERRLEFNVARKCRAQAASLMRDGKSSLRLLLRLQAMREAREADGGKADRAAWAEHCAMSMMSEGLAPAAAEPGEAAVGAGTVSTDGTTSPHTASETDMGFLPEAEADVAVTALIREVAGLSGRSLRDALMSGAGDAGRMLGGPAVRGRILPARQVGRSTRA